MHLRILRHILLFAFGLLNLVGFSQINNFRHWSVAEGLPQSNIYAIKQDQRGYLWIGTGGGLSRFDGKKFVNFTRPNAPVGNTVRKIFEDSRGWLWFGTNQGISIYDGYRFRSFSKKDGLSGSTVLCFLEDKAGIIWAGSDDGGVNQIQVKSADSLKVDVLDQSNGMSSNAIFGLAEADDGSIWAASFGGVNRFKKEGQQYKIDVIQGPGKIPSDLLLCVEKDAEGWFWFGSYDAGVFKLKINPQTGHPDLEASPFGNNPSPASVWDLLPEKESMWLVTAENGLFRYFHKAKQLENYGNKEGLASNQLLCLEKDREGNVWMGSNGDGLMQWHGDAFSHFTLGNGLPNLKIMGLDQDSDGGIWIATDGGGIAKFTDKNKLKDIQVIHEGNGLPSNYITSIAVGKGSNPHIWIGTANRGLVKFDGKGFAVFNDASGLEISRINTVFVDSKGLVWCGTADGISKFDGSKFNNLSTEGLMMENKGVYVILEDKKENIWFGTAGGLARYRGDKTLRTFDEVEGLDAKQVNALAEDKMGNIWIGTQTGGVYKFDVSQPDTLAISQVLMEPSVSSNTVQSLVFVDAQTLLVGSAKGFDKVVFNEKGEVTQVRNYNQSDGFLGIECNPNALLKEKNGSIWFGTVKGLSCYKPSLERKSRLAPLVHLAGLELFYETVDWTTKANEVNPWFKIPEQLSLQYFDNNLTFLFGAISLENPERILYKYQLEGWDSQWSKPNTTTEANFSGLTNGTYTFRVMAMNAAGVWSEALSYTFTIQPPWYKTWWAYLSYVFIGFLSVFLFIRYREQKLQREKQVLEETVVERTAEVVKQKEEIEHQKKDILDSITYAQRIQLAILPPIELIQEYVPETFVLFKPKDIVAGDFFWFSTSAKDPNLFFIAACDCTGHGVPGAMVSVVCSNALNRAVNEFGLVETGFILDKTRELVLETFEKSGKDVKDGMDISLLAIHKKDDGVEVQWSGANNSLLYFDKSEGLKEIKPDKQPIGRTDNPSPFISHRIPDGFSSFYLYTDGYSDQFGQNDKKLMKKRFKEALENIQGMGMAAQENYLSSFWEDWKGSKDQTDDVTVIGIKI